MSFLICKKTICPLKILETPLKKIKNVLSPKLPNDIEILKEYNGWIESAMESSIRVLVNKSPNRYDEKFLEGNT